MDKSTSDFTKLRQYYIDKVFSYLQISLKKQISESLQNKKIYQIYQDFLSRMNQEKYNLVSLKTKNYPYCLIGIIKLIFDGTEIFGVGILIDQNHILTSSDAISPVVKNKRVLVDPSQIYFMYDNKEYQAKNLYRFHNYNQIDILLKIKENLSQANTDNFFLDHVLSFIKSNITFIELKESVSCKFPNEFFQKIQNCIIGHPYTFIEDNQLYKVKMISFINKKLIENEKTKLFEPILNDESFYIEAQSITKISSDYGYLIFDLKAYDFFCGSPLFININGEEVLIGLFTTFLKNTQEMFDILKFNNDLKKYSCVGFKLINLNILKHHKVLREEHLSIIDAKSINYCFQYLRSLAYLDLEYYKLGDKGVKSIIQSFQYLTNLRKLLFSNNEIGLEGAKIITPFLQYFIKLKELDLNCNNLGDLGIQMVASSFQYLTVLKSLYLGFNNIGENGAKALASNFQYLTKLKILNLQGNNIKEEGGRYISETLFYLKDLVDLNIENCNIGEAGAIFLAKPLQFLTKIQKLDIYGNYMGPLGGKEMGKSIYFLKDLTKFYFGNNILGEEGVFAMADCLQSLENLKELGSVGNNIGDKGTEYLSKYLKNLFNIKKLYLPKNNIGDAGVKHLANILCYLPNLVILSLEGNNISEVGKNEIEKEMPEGCSLYI